ncbi:hypothetical protein Syun_028904 [Stephania yunnanensis]|uniref:Uncharacterized protein n=1 Tax=Stephania yunnanensis TaxID=152371 RepID=A0AAP0E6Z7_9MAGN
MACSELVSMPQLELMTSLEELTIYECPKLKFVFHGLRHLTSLQLLRIRGCPGVVIPKEEFDALVALRGPSLLDRVDKKLIHEDSTTTLETRGKQVFQVLIDDDHHDDNNNNKDVDEVLIHDHYQDYSQSTTTTTVPEIIRKTSIATAYS